jgi:hypothetical protein
MQTIKKFLDDTKKLRRYAVLAGALLALICNRLPSDYQVVCSAIAKICTLGG